MSKVYVVVHGEFNGTPWTVSVHRTEEGARATWHTLIDEQVREVRKADIPADERVAWEWHVDVLRGYAHNDFDYFQIEEYDLED